jgi:hypothetical protein
MATIGELLAVAVEQLGVTRERPHLRRRQVEHQARHLSHRHGRQADGEESAHQADERQREGHQGDAAAKNTTPRTAIGARQDRSRHQGLRSHVDLREGRAVRRGRDGHEHLQAG